jgi:hypothetical protein
MYIEKIVLDFKVIPLLLLFILQLQLISGQVKNSDSAIIEGLNEIQILLHKDRINAQRWWYGWLTGYSAATVGQGIVYFSSDKERTRQDMALGSATTFLGAIGLLITPIVPHNPDLKDSPDPAGASKDQYNKQEQYEELLKEIALREKAGRSWKPHAIAGVVNIGSGLITWLGFRRSFVEGLGNFALNTVITEAQIWTQPTRAVKDYQNFIRKYHPGSVPGVTKPAKELLVRAHPGGIAFELDF